MLHAFEILAFDLPVVSLASFVLQFLVAVFLVASVLQVVGCVSVFAVALALIDRT